MRISTGATHLSSTLTKAHRGLVRLSLSHCGLTGKGVAQIGHALAANKFMSSTLTYLDLSNNAAKDEINVTTPPPPCPESHPSLLTPTRSYFDFSILFILIGYLQFLGSTERRNLFEFIKHRYLAWTGMIASCEGSCCTQLSFFLSLCFLCLPWFWFYFWFSRSLERYWEEAQLVSAI